MTLIPTGAVMTTLNAQLDRPLSVGQQGG